MSTYSKHGGCQGIKKGVTSSLSIKVPKQQFNRFHHSTLRITLRPVTVMSIISIFPLNSYVTILVYLLAVTWSNYGVREARPRSFNFAYARAFSLMFCCHVAFEASLLHYLRGRGFFAGDQPFGGLEGICEMEVKPLSSHPLAPLVFRCSASTHLRRIVACLGRDTWQHLKLDRPCNGFKLIVKSYRQHPSISHEL